MFVVPIIKIVPNVEMYEWFGFNGGELTTFYTDGQ